MKYRYRYVDQMVEMIEGSRDPAVKMAVIWANKDQPNLVSLLKLLYDYRWNFEIGGLPKYRRNRNGGMELNSAIGLLEQRLNGRLISSATKFKFVVDILNKLQDRDAEVLSRALQHQINLRIPLEDIQRAFPDIKRDETFADRQPKALSLPDLQFPGTIVRQTPGHEIRVVINGNGNFKFVDDRGHGLVLPDKINSAFIPIFSKLRNVALSAVCLGMTKDKSKIGNTATSNAVFAKFQMGELEAETISVRILDAVDLWSYLNYPQDLQQRALPFAARREWIVNNDWTDSIHVSVADAIEVATIEDLRKLENEVFEAKDTLRFYGNKATWGKGFHVLDKSAF